jgi:hypothetical protein
LYSAVTISNPVAVNSHSIISRPYNLLLLCMLPAKEEEIMRLIFLGNIFSSENSDFPVHLQLLNVKKQIRNDSLETILFKIET